MMDCQLKLKRIFLGATYTIGKLYINGEYFCDTLEDRVRPANSPKVFGETAIPYGKYKVILTKSPKFQRILPYLLDVPNFTGILIHAGNTDKDTAGCILVGKNSVKGKVTNSRFWEGELVDKLMLYNSISIEIV